MYRTSTFKDPTRKNTVLEQRYWLATG